MTGPPGLSPWAQTPWSLHSHSGRCGKEGSCPGSHRYLRQDQVWAWRQDVDPGRFSHFWYEKPRLGVVISRRVTGFGSRYLKITLVAVWSRCREQSGGEAGAGYTPRLKQMSFGERLGGGHRKGAG